MGQCGRGCVHDGRYGHKRREERHKRWPEALKREIVAATFEAGASVSMVARQYDVNANQVFSWRRHYREAGRAISGFMVDARPVALRQEAGARSLHLAVGGEWHRLDIGRTARLHARRDRLP